MPVAVVAALVEAVAALAVFGLLRLVVDPAQVRTAPVVSSIWRSWPTDDPLSVVAALTIAIAALYIVRGLLIALSEWLRERTVHQTAARTSERLFARYLAADYLFHVRRQSASFIEEITRSSELAFQFVLASSVHLITEVLTAVALVAVLTLNAPLVTLAKIGRAHV